MKQEFPELSTERINALFLWTIWMSQSHSKVSCRISEKDPNAFSFCEEGVAIPDELTPMRSDAESGGDPLLGCSVMPATRSFTTGSKTVVDELVEIAAALDSPENVASSNMNVINASSESDVEFPDLCQVDEMDFDFGD